MDNKLIDVLNKQNDYQIENISILLIENILESIIVHEGSSFEKLEKILITENGILMNADNFQKNLKDTLSLMYQLKIINITKNNKLSKKVSVEELIPYLIKQKYNSELLNKKVQSLVSERGLFSPFKIKKDTYKTIPKEYPTLF